MKLSGNRAVSILLLAALSAACLLLPAVAQDEPAIKIARLAGPVEVSHSQATKGQWQKASTDNLLSAGWQLRTLEGGKAQLVFPQDNVVILKENSVLYIDKLDFGGGAKLESDQGSLLVDIKNALSPGSEFELKTPTALAVVRGTKYGAEIGLPAMQYRESDFEFVTFHGFDGTVEIYNDLGTVFMPADTSVQSAGDAAPGEPEPSGDEAAAFLAELEDTGPFEAAEAVAADFLNQLTPLSQDLQMISETLADYEDEWRRMEHSDQETQMLYLYAQVLGLRERVDDDNEKFLGIQEDLGNADPAVPGIFGVGQLLDSIAALIADLYERLDAFDDDAGPFVTDNQELLDNLNGLIAPGDPQLGLRWKLIDTDNDGVSDVDETELGLDPFGDNSDGFIPLVAPDDGEELEYPATAEAVFEFEPLESDLIEGYDLVLSSGGRQWLRRNVDDSEAVQLSELVDEGGAFFDLIGADDRLDIEWYVLAHVEADALFARISQLNPGFAPGLGNTLSSEHRQLILVLPPPPELVVIDLAAAGPQTVSPDQPVTIRGSISEVDALGMWEITVAYDPTVLDFDSGRRLGLFGSSTVFFGDEPGGYVVISGQSPRGGGGISGEGDIFELSFTAVDEGESSCEVQDAVLSDTLSREIPAEGGESVEITVARLANANEAPGGKPFNR